METRSLWQLGSQLYLLNGFVREIFPLVDQELERWRRKAGECPDRVLATQALNSIRMKRFHAQGGSVYALYPGVDRRGFVAFVVALQTISDYLDNLCDRVGVMDEAGFRQLHLAMVDALTPGGKINDYYACYPHRCDGGYLEELVRTCQERVARLPGYSLVGERARGLAGLYADLQTFKHLPLEIREEKMLAWTSGFAEAYPGITGWEFAAATGSTLGIFILCACASDPELNEVTVEKIERAYFPWINGLHILLDYFIDQQEDRQEGDLNFVSYYADSGECETRLQLFVRKSLQEAAMLPHHVFHTTVVEGLLAMYLSDPKASKGEEGLISRRLLKSVNIKTDLWCKVCKWLRKKGVL